LAVPYRMTQIRREWPYQGQLVRFNVGLEDTADLIDDLHQAFECL
jgi:cysteine-S-conjugate beta-lyase